VRAVLGGESDASLGGTGLMAPVPEDAGRIGRPWRLAGESIRLVIATEAVALTLGLPLAFLLFRTDAWGRRVLLAVLAIGVFVPLPLHATAWLGAFGNAGRMQVLGVAPVLVGWTGAAFVHAMAALPWVVLLAGVGLRTVEPELEEAALLDLAGWRVVYRVTLRRAVGAVAAAALAVAVLTAGDMTVTDLLQVRTYAEEAYLQFQLGNGPAAATRVSLPPLILLGGLILLGARGLLNADPARLATAASRARIWRLGAWRVPLGVAAVLIVGNLAALPLYSLVWRAGRVGGRAARGAPPRWSLAGLAGTMNMAWDEAVEPLIQSLTLAAAAATVAVVLAWALAWFSRVPGPWRIVTAASVAIVLATPGPVAGMGLKFAYHPSPLVADTAAIVVLAGVLRTFPYALIVLWAAVRGLPPELLDASAVDGLGAWGQAWKVAIPLTRGALAASWFATFALALGELPATNLVTPPGLMPLSVLIWGLLHTGVESHLAGVALVMLGVIAAAGGMAAAALGWASRSSRTE
jgi:iron(III) transport system permease protein